jgi:Na+-transporting methylmalonyl-CoA/oxaloacetate decarboxylase gamma subunit
MLKKNEERKKITEFIPFHVLAGSRGLFGHSAREVCWNGASQLWDTPNVHIIHSVYQGKVYFLSAPSKEFTNLSHNEFGTVIGHFLPGGSEFKGEGVYFYQTVNFYFMMFFEKNILNSYIGSLSEGDRLLKQFQLEEKPVYDMQTVDIQPKRWENFHSVMYTKYKNILSISGSVFFVLSMIIMAIFVISKIEETKISDLHTEREQKFLSLIQETNTVLKEQDNNIAINKELSEYENIINFCLKYNGSIKKLSKDNKSKDISYLIYFSPDINPGFLEKNLLAKRTFLVNEENNWFLAAEK